MNNVQPLFNDILIEPVEKKDVLVMDGEQKFFTYGKVIAIGDEVQKIKVGDYIGFAIWGLMHNEIGGKRYYFVPEMKGINLHKIDSSMI